MSGKTYKTRAIVLRKVKLREKDLIVSLLDGRGSLVRAVAKGARKPGGSFAARLELFSVVDLMLVEGKNLDVVTSAVLAADIPHGVRGVEQTACAAALAELIETVAIEGVPNRRLFAMAQAAFIEMGKASPESALALACSSMLKTLAYEGFRPLFSKCSVCSGEIDLQGAIGAIPVSISEGGSVCGNCPRPYDSILYDAGTLSWAQRLLHARFAEIPSLECETRELVRIAGFVQQWCRYHLDKNMKSLNFLLSCGLY